MSESDVGARIRRLRERAGLTLDDMTELTRLSPPTLSRLERGTQRVRLEHLEIIAKALGVSVGRLIKKAA